MLRVLALLILSLCNLQDADDRYAHITDRKARKIIKASIEHAGGIELWENLKNLEYTKSFTLYDSEGKVEKAFDQKHDYNYELEHFSIRSHQDEKMVETQLSKGVYSRTTMEGLTNPASLIRQDDQVKLAKAMNTSLYVVSMPFKLLDPGAEISYEGETTMEDGRVADVVQVVYNAEKYENHSSSEVWKYYFDKEDRKIVGNWIQSSDHLNLVENLTFIRAGGILFNGERKSWRIDEAGNKLYLRASYNYYHYEVE